MEKEYSKFRLVKFFLWQAIDPLKNKSDLRFEFSTAKYNTLPETEGLSEENRKKVTGRGTNQKQLFSIKLSFSELTSSVK